MTVDSNDEVVCTITNTRRNGQLTVVKDLKPGDDPGRFDLKIGDDVVKAGAGDGDAGSKSLPRVPTRCRRPGSRWRSTTRASHATTASPVEGSSLAGVTVDSNDDVTCTITNTRRAGKLTVVKDLEPGG